MTWRRAITVFGVLCLVAALALTLYNMIDAANAGKQSSDIVDKLTEDISQISTAEPSEKQTPSLIIDGVRYLGYLEIPKLSISLPIAADYSFEQLYTSPALFSGSFETADAVIAAHNYVTHFGRLRRLEVGDELVFTDAGGNRYLYTVAWQQNVLPSDREKMVTKNGWDLTLFTCNYDKSLRYTLRCILKEESK